MRQIKLKGSQALVNLNKFFYPKQALKQAVNKFKKIADISIEEKGSRLLLTINPKKGSNAEETALHFCNLALSLRREAGENA